jgi:hypothetical protein
MQQTAHLAGLGITFQAFHLAYPVCYQPLSATDAMEPDLVIVALPAIILLAQLAA